jgi:thioredoxin reductase (NADPH)
VRGDHLTATQVAADKVNEHHKIDVMYNTEVAEFRGDPRLEEVLVRDRKTGEVKPLDPAPAGVFVFIGLSPNSNFVPPGVKKDEQGFIVTSPTLETGIPGVFAGGDVRAGSTKQAASAAGEGATAALMIREYLRKLG